MKARVDVDERGRLGDACEASDIREHIVQRRHAQVWDAEVHQRHAAAAHVERLVPKVLGHPAHVGTRRPDDLEGLLAPLSVEHERAEARPGGARARGPLAHGACGTQAPAQRAGDGGHGCHGLGVPGGPWSTQAEGFAQTGETARPTFGRGCRAKFD